MNKIQILKQALQGILKAVEETLASGEELSDEIQGEVAKIIQLLLEKIQKFKQQESEVEQLTPPSQPQLQEAMPSSNVEGFSYDNDNNRLLVRFLGDYPNRQGPVYSYENVPRVIFDLFHKGMIPARTDGKNKWGKWWKGKTPSIGASLYTLIKNGGYDYRRVA
jgi:hypothetical protein